MEKAWAEEAAALVDLLGLQKQPVAVIFTNEEVPGEQKKTWVCRAMKLASVGKAFVIDREHSACGGGSWHCGLSEPPAGPARRALQQFLTRGEKLTASITSFQRMQQLGSPPPTGMAERVFIGPLAEAPMRPDLALFVCDAEQACRILTLDHFWDGVPPQVEVSGSLCHSAISYPLTTGHTNLTLGDWTARRMQKYGSGDIFVTVPYERMHNLVLAIPECSAGTAEVEIPPEMRRAIHLDDSDL